MRPARRSLLVGVVVGAIAVAGAIPASATQVSIPCGSGGTAKIGIVVSGSNYKTRETNSKSTSYLEADIQWRAPAVGAPLTWYYGSFNQATTVYSPGVSTSNYPNKMAGLIWVSESVNCDASVTASNW